MRVCPIISHQKSCEALSAHVVLIPFLVALLAASSAAPAFAQIVQDDDPLRFVRWPVQDVRTLAGSVTANHAALIGAGVVVYAIAQRDPGLRRAVQEAAPSPHSPIFRAVEEVGNVKSVRPAALMLFLGSLASGNERFQDAAFTSLEAVVLSNLMTSVLKSAIGRARPYQESDPLSFDPFSGNTSFPSGHSTTAFALVTPWLLYYPHPVTVGLMVVGAGTALSRVASDFHWVSDVVAGSTIGFATAYILTQAHLNRSESLRVSPIITEDGAGISVALRP